MKKNEIDLLKLIKYILKRAWLPVILAIIGALGMYFYTAKFVPNTYTASVSMYVYNGNPNAVNYQYANASDLNAANMLIDTYSVVIKSNKVLEAVASILGGDMSPADISKSLNISSINDTNVMVIKSTTSNPELSMNICNAIADIAPEEIIRVVSAGNVEIIDYASMPLAPNDHQTKKKAMMGGLAGAVIGAFILVIIFLMDRKLTDSSELTDNYEYPILATIPKLPGNRKEGEYYQIGVNTPSGITAAYAKLRLNTAFAIHNKRKIIVVSSSIPKETKSTVAANLAISFSLDGKKVLIVDCDLRSPTQHKLFNVDIKEGGLSEILVPETGKTGKIWYDVKPRLDLITTGTVPPNPTELLGSQEMTEFMLKKETEYDIIILDTPPINVVTDSLIPSTYNVGMLFVTRCGFSDHREIRKAISAAQYTKMDILGMVMTCADKMSDGYYNNRYYKKYYSSYDKKNVKTKK